MKAKPDISYIVSAFNRPYCLPGCLWSLKVQTHENFEVIVTDNAEIPWIAAHQRRTVKEMRDPRFKYVRTFGKIKVSDCYWSAEWAVRNMARGNWYAFPCDDSYYVPEYGQRMLSEAIRQNLGFVMCGNPVVGPESQGGSGYNVWQIGIGRTIKTTFLVRADVFPGFCWKPTKSMAAAADYEFGRHMQKDGVKCGVVPGSMLVHN